MKEPAEPAHPASTSVPAALLEYFEAPGKYQLTLRQPAALFASVREILQLASDRGASDAPQSGHLRDAANFFIRAALLYPGGDHYAVLGLAPGETATDLKERYRLLMRLIHPDFAGSGSTAWPADAAVRVNRAYEVLSSPVLRREYDDQLASLRSQRPAAAKPPTFAAPVARRPEEPQGRVSKKAALVFGLAVGIPAVLLLLPRSEPDHLVQRLAPPASAQRAGPVQAEPPPPAPATAVAAAPVPQAPASPASAAAATASIAAPEAPLPLPTPPQVATAASKPVATLPPAAPARPASIAAPAPRVPPVAVAANVRPAAVVAPARPVEPPPSPVPPPLPATPSYEPAVAVVPMPPPAPVLAAVSTTPMTAAATVAPSVPAAAKLTTTAALPAVPAPTLADAQPLLTQVLQMLESGSGDQLLRLLDGDARKQPGALALSRQYEQLVRGGRQLHVGQVDFKGEPREGGVLLVTGQIRLHTSEPTIGSYGQKLVVRAEFAQRGGKVQLTGLSGAPE